MSAGTTPPDAAPAAIKSPGTLLLFNNRLVALPEMPAQPICDVVMQWSTAESPKVVSVTADFADNNKAGPQPIAIGTGTPWWRPVLPTPFGSRAADAPGATAPRLSVVDSTTAWNPADRPFAWGRAT
jgi:hypothetical protein